MRVFVALALVVTILSFAPAVAAQDGILGQAGIRFGDCTVAAIDHALIVPELPLTDHAGASTAMPAGQSFSAVPVPLATLLAQESTVLLIDPDGETVACGPIGGFPSADGSLVIGLYERDASEVTGVAYLAPAPDGLHTNVSLFATGDRYRHKARSRDVARDPVPAGEQSSAQEITQADRDYISYFDGSLRSVIESSQRTAVLFQNPRLNDSDWNIDLAVELTRWRTLYQEAQQQSPPPRFAELHGRFTEMLRLLDSATYDIVTGVDTEDPAFLNQGVGKIETATTIMNEITAMLEAMLREIGIEP